MVSEIAHVLVPAYALAFGLGFVGGWIVREWYHYMPVKAKIREAEERVATNARKYWRHHLAELLRSVAADRDELAAFWRRQAAADRSGMALNSGIREKELLEHSADTLECCAQAISGIGGCGDHEFL